MSKTKYAVIGGGFVTFVAALIVGVWFLQGHSVRNNRQATLAANSGDGSISLSANANSDSVPLNGQSEASGTGSGLHVSSGGSAMDLGQLSPSQGQQGVSGGSSNNGSSPSDPFDPSTFIQYDKYKAEKDALFAEVQKGTGDELTANKKAAVYYKGWLTDGTIFDQSRKDDKGQLQPFVFTEGAHQVIPGWEEGLIGMKVGGTRLVIVPPAAGYGESGQGGIPGNSVLIFEVQLLAVQ